MKKLIYSIFLGLFLTLTACQSINHDLTVLSRCCKVLSVTKSDKNREAENKESEYSNTSSLLPVNSWDGKMMIW